MTTAEFQFEQNELLTSRPILPLLEVGAYEALWDRKGMTFKRMGDLFRKHRGVLPSELVGPGEAEAYAKKVRQAFLQAQIEEVGVRIHNAGDYPMRLRDADHPSELLYYRGWWEIAERPAVAVVGTREPSDEGVRRAQRVAHWLVSNDFTVVSGLAKGIDAAAHRKAIESGGFTAAVLGTPITEYYPKENRELQELIAKDHVLISQVPVVRYSRGNPLINRMWFPERNVTMSALTRATIIIEAGETSGTLVQARHALKQKRKLLILENCFHRGLSWPEKFVSRGAIRVSDTDQLDEVLQREVQQG